MRRLFMILCAVLVAALAAPAALGEPAEPDSLILLRDFSNHYAAYGDWITLSYTVRNASAQTISSISITDPLMGDVGQLDTLLPGASHVITTHVRVTSDCESRPSAQFTLDGQVSTVSAEPGSIYLENVALSAILSSEQTESGRVISLTITNQGSAPLYRIKAADATLGDMGSVIDRLDPGETATLSRTARSGRFQCTVSAVSSAGKTVTLLSNGLMSDGAPASNGTPELSAERDSDGLIYVVLSNSESELLRNVTLRELSAGFERTLYFVPAGGSARVLWPRGDQIDTLNFEALLEDGRVLSAELTLPDGAPAIQPERTEEGVPVLDGPSFHTDENPQTYRQMMILTGLALGLFLLIWRLSFQRRKQMERKRRQRQRQESRKRQRDKKSGEKNNDTDRL